MICILFITDYKNRLYVTCKNWICGTTEESKAVISKEEKKRIRDKMTSIAEKPRQRIILNVLALAVSMLTVFLLGFYR